MRIEAGIDAEQGRAIGADDLDRVAHVEEDVGVIERRQGADAHEFLRPDLDDLDPRFIVEVGNDVVRHGADSVTILMRRGIAPAAGKS